MGLLDLIKGLFNRDDHLPEITIGGNQQSQSPGQGGSAASAGSGGRGPESAGGGSGASPSPTELHKLAQAFIDKTVKAGCVTACGLHVETLLSSFGALAGFGCQMAVRSMVEKGHIPAGEAFMVANTADGSKYFFGPHLNMPLISAPVSVVGLICGGINRAGSTDYPNVEAMASHVVSTFGNESFGRLTVPANHQPLISPLDSLKRFWPQIYPTFSIFFQGGLEPMSFGWQFAEAAQRVIVEAKDILPPPLAGRIALESAMFMSKIDPALIPTGG